MTYAVVFPGQGSQHADLLPWLDADPAAAGPLRALAAHVGTGWRARLRDARQRGANAFAQPLLTGVSLAAWDALRPALPGPPAALAGYSVGELAAWSAAGVFDAERAVALAVERAAAMDRAAAGADGGLLSVSGATDAVVAERCAGLRLECAIRIDVDHALWAGGAQALDRAETALAAAGAVCRRLDIRVASHSSAMAAAAAEFARTLRDVPFAAARCPIAANATGSALRAAEPLRRALAAQIAITVQWAGCMATLAERGVACVLEVGPGSALARLWNARYPHCPARALEDFRDARGAAVWVARQVSGAG